MNETLTNEQAFRAMVIFLEAFYARTNSDDVGGLLGDLMRRTDGKTADPAAWTDWTDWMVSVQKALVEEGRPHNTSQ
jgi:hypothetical protein